ncbi:MAG: PEP-CTERM sorting domain-containing protein [Desulfobacterales bacterium]
MKKFYAVLTLVIAVFAFGTSNSSATLIDLGPSSFNPLASVITFDEFADGTVNPSIDFYDLEGLGDITVSFGGHFIGQQAVGSYPVTLTGTPDGALALDPNAPETFVTDDGATGATSPILSGSPRFNGPISILFSQPVAAVGLKGGYFNATGGTSIEAYAEDGTVLGSITNTVTGFEFYGLADDSGENVIKGLSFYITGDEPAGFEIDDLTFGAAEVLVDPPGTEPVPEPATILLLGSGLLGVGVRSRKKFRK